MQSHKLRSSEKYAPIIVSVYDRPHHFQKCIESLSRNVDAENTILFISSDGPTNTQESKDRVNQVREYLKSINGFKRVVSYCPRTNTNGAIKGTVFERVKSDFSTYIKTEDDNIFAPYALKYFNQNLEIYKDDPSVHAVCGYMYPDFPYDQKEQIFLKCFSFWGTAFWRDKDIYPEIDEIQFINEIFQNKMLYTKINKTLPHLAPMMKAMVNGELQAGDVTRCAYMIKNEQVSVFPSLSLVQNIGNDGTGLNCQTDESFAEQKITRGEITISSRKPSFTDPKHASWLQRFFGGKKSIIRGQLIWHEHSTTSVIVQKMIALVLLTGRKINRIIK